MRKAALHYLKLRGCTVLDDDYEGLIVFQDNDGAVVFAGIDWHVGEEPHETKMVRDKFEQLMFKWFEQERDVVDVPVRYDIIDIHVIHSDRAIIRHVIDVQLM